MTTIIGIGAIVTAAWWFTDSAQNLSTAIIQQIESASPMVSGWGISLFEGQSEVGQKTPCVVVFLRPTENESMRASATPSDVNPSLVFFELKRILIDAFAGAGVGGIKVLPHPLSASDYERFNHRFASLSWADLTQELRADRRPINLAVRSYINPIPVSGGRERVVIGAELRSLDLEHLQFRRLPWPDSKVVGEGSRMRDLLLVTGAQVAHDLIHECGAIDQNAKARVWQDFWLEMRSRMLAGEPLARLATLEKPCADEQCVFELAHYLESFKTEEEQDNKAAVTGLETQLKSFALARDSSGNTPQGSD